MRYRKGCLVCKEQKKESVFDKALVICVGLCVFAQVYMMYMSVYECVLV